MEITYTATISAYGIKMTRTRVSYGVSSDDIGFQHFELPAAAANAKITLMDIAATLALHGYTVSGAWGSYKVDGITYFTVPVTKTGV